MVGRDEFGGHPLLNKGSTELCEATVIFTTRLDHSTWKFRASGRGKVSKRDKSNTLDGPFHTFHVVSLETRMICRVSASDKGVGTDSAVTESPHRRTTETTDPSLRFAVVTVQGISIGSRSTVPGSPTLLSKNLIRDFSPKDEYMNGSIQVRGEKGEKAVL